VTYKFLPDAEKRHAEFKLLQQAMASAPNGIHQGIYVITPSGKYLGKVDQGWPTYDTAAALRNMKTILAKYQAMPRAERLRRVPMAEADRSFKRAGYGTAPEGTVKLRSVSRGIEFDDMQLFDLRHPTYFKVDRLWFSPNELTSLVPRDHTAGATAPVNQMVLQRIARFNHFMLGGMPWNDESLKKLEMTTTVAKVTDGKVYAKLNGVVEMKSNTRWNQSGYSGKVLGKVVWNTRSRSFEMIELVALGTHSLPRLARNVHRGDTKETQVAMRIGLDEKSPNEKEICPASIQEYPRNLKPAAFRDIKW